MGSLATTFRAGAYLAGAKKLVRRHFLAFAVVVSALATLAYTEVQLQDAMEAGRQLQKDFVSLRDSYEARNERSELTREAHDTPEQSLAAPIAHPAFDDAKKRIGVNQYKKEAAAVQPAGAAADEEAYRTLLGLSPPGQPAGRR